MMDEKIKQGDIIKVNLNPAKGHEQAGYRPVLIINNASHTKASNMTIICPITSTDRHNPLHVPLLGLTTTGFVMCDQIRTIDLHARDYQIAETIDYDTLWDVCDIVQGMFDIEL